MSCEENDAGSHRCELCEREGFVTDHHLVPRMLHGRNSIKRRFAPEELEQTVHLCDDCHTQIHRLVSEKKMGQALHSLRSLRAYPTIARYLRWVKGRPVGVISHQMRG